MRRQQAAQQDIQADGRAIAWVNQPLRRPPLNLALGLMTAGACARLIAIALNRDAEDIERIPAMQDLLLEVKEEAEQSSAISDALTRIASDKEEDVLARQHAANELGFYPAPLLLSGLLAVLSDGTDDLDIRVNLLSAFERWKHPSLNTFEAALSEHDGLRRYVHLHRG